MSNPDRWLILRVTAGLPLKVEAAVRALGIATCCPSETIRRKHPFDRRMVLEYQRPILGGYVFVAEPFEVEAITTTRVRARLMAFEGRYMQVPDRELKRVCDVVANTSRVFWSPQIADIVSGLHQATIGVLPKSFVTLGELQTMARVAA